MRFAALYALLLALLACTPASAQMSLMPQYDRLTFMQFAARVESVNTLQNPNNGRFGLHLFVRDAFSALYLVHICPQWYADSHPEQFTFQPGDQLIISGSRFSTGLTPNNILAATIINCSRRYLQLRIREPLTGSPLWSNQPDNLLERIIEMQKKLFSKQSEAMRSRVKEALVSNKTKLAWQPQH
jgi:hypothetical protein